MIAFNPSQGTMRSIFVKERRTPCYLRMTLEVSGTEGDVLVSHRLQMYHKLGVNQRCLNIETGGLVPRLVAKCIISAIKTRGEFQKPLCPGRTARTTVPLCKEVVGRTLAVLFAKAGK